MVEATTDDGQRLLALNEIFVGHKSHQSARYRVCVGDRAERQSSSGVVVATGTGATGWARSIASVRSPCPALPHPTDRAAVFFVREPWPSVTTGTEVIDGRLGPDDSMRITSEMNDGGVCFGDGIEDDHLVVPFGTTLRIGVAASALHVL